MWEKAHNQPKKAHYLFIVRSTQNLLDNKIINLQNVINSFEKKVLKIVLRRLLNIFSIGSNVKIKSSHGGHLEFPISDSI
jgi:hypothetical protein